MGGGVGGWWWGWGFFYTYHAGFIFILGVSLTHPVLVSYLSGEFSYTSHTGFPFLWGVSLTLPVLLRFCFVFVYFFVFVLSGEFLLDIPYWFLSPFFSFFSFLFFKKTNKLGVVSHTHPVLASFLSGEFLSHIPCGLHFYLGSFSYTPRAGFIFIWGVSLTHPVLASFSSGEFLLHIPRWVHF